MVAVLCKLFGIENIQVAEDLVSDTFLLASETWGLKGQPQNPVAWLYTVAKNKTRDELKHNAVFRNKIVPDLKFADLESYELVPDLSNRNIVDSQLQMMFAICHPCISIESQVGLSLSILCGFGVEEIADAFLSTKEAVYKKLSRAKEKLRREHIKIDFPDSSQINSALAPVLTTLYLLFSEGYYSSSQNTVLRKDLCLEAMRLNLMLVENKDTDLPAVNALLALMCFHSSRFDARVNSSGENILYQNQDAGLWNQELISKGIHYLNRAACGNKMSKYHLEAAIAYWHTNHDDTKEKWEEILQLYNRLLQIKYSPVAALNRTYALAKANGREIAIQEAEKLKLTDNYLYHLLLAELYAGINNEKHFNHLQASLSLAKTKPDKEFIVKKISAAQQKN